MDVNELCNQKRVDSLFIPIKDKNPKLKDKIEQIEFLFKNSIYNFNRLRGEIGRLNQGFNFPDTPYYFQMKIPVTVWADILVFEFQSCLYNIIRTANFLTVFNVKEINSINKVPSISQYVKDKKNYSGSKNFKLFDTNYFGWIEDVNRVRNDFTHENLTKKIVGYMIMNRIKTGNSVKEEGKFIVGIQEHNVDDFERYISERIDYLEKLILDFFN